MTQNTAPDPALRLQQAYALRETDPARAFEEYRTLSADGYPDAMMQLAWCYQEGIGTVTNMSLAELWFRRAYEKGTDRAKRQAIYYLGRYYLMQKDYSKARDIFSIGDAINYSPATYHLGRLYWRGIGVKKQPSEARMLFERASKQGHLLAKRNLAILLMSGRFGIWNIFRGLYLLFQSFKEFSTVQYKVLCDGSEDERVMN